MCICASVCVRLIIFPLHALLADNLITTFSDTLTSRSKIALRNVAHFCQGGGLWDVFVGRYFLPFFFQALFFHCQQYCQLFTLPVSPRRGEEMNRGGRDGKICHKSEKMRFFSLQLSQAKLLFLQNACIVKALPTTKNLRCWLLLVYFLVYSSPVTTEFYITA